MKICDPYRVVLCRVARLEIYDPFRVKSIAVDMLRA